jgi:hypothetical protein
MMFNILKRLFPARSGRKSDHAAYNTISGEDLPEDNEFEFLPENKKTRCLKFSWRDVKPCLKDKLDNMKFKGHQNCPKCGRQSEDLVWINFNSPPWTWQSSVGRQGPLSICPICKIQVDFLCVYMN